MSRLAVKVQSQRLLRRLSHGPCSTLLTPHLAVCGQPAPEARCLLVCRPADGSSGTRPEWKPVRAGMRPSPGVGAGMRPSPGLKPGKIPAKIVALYEPEPGPADSSPAMRGQAFLYKSALPPDLTRGVGFVRIPEFQVVGRYSSRPPVQMDRLSASQGGRLGQVARTADGRLGHYISCHDQD
ncbi:hypothetical protein Bbelb_384950 [Branchiostoma belcheri]|nr:hypothetical protein Bbelb_384950 [Branchiostoma belcheri]